MTTQTKTDTAQAFSGEIDARDEVKRLVALAVTSGVAKYSDLAKRTSRSKTLAQNWGNPEEDGDLPAFALVVDDAFRAFMLPQLDKLAARVRARRPHVDAPEAGAYTVFARVGEWMIAASEALRDKVITRDESTALLPIAVELRGALDTLIEQLTSRASEPPAAPMVWPKAVSK